MANPNEQANRTWRGPTALEVLILVSFAIVVTDWFITDLDGNNSEITLFGRSIFSNIFGR